MPAGHPPGRAHSGQVARRSESAGMYRRHSSAVRFRPARAHASATRPSSSRDSTDTSLPPGPSPHAPRNRREPSGAMSEPNAGMSPERRSPSDRGGSVGDVPHRRLLELADAGNERAPVLLPGRHDHRPGPGGWGARVVAAWVLLSASFVLPVAMLLLAAPTPEQTARRCSTTTT